MLNLEIAEPSWDGIDAEETLSPAMHRRLHYCGKCGIPRWHAARETDDGLLPTIPP